MNETIKNKEIYIVKDTIIFKQKDSLTIQSIDLRNLTTQVEIVNQNFEKLINSDTSYFGVKSDTLFTVFTTILIFIVGFLLNKWNHNRIEKNKLKELNNYFINEISDIKNILPKLIEVFTKFYTTTIDINNGIPTSPPKSLSNSWKRLKNLDTNLLFNSFDNKDEYKRYINVVHSLDNIYKIIDDYHSIVLIRSERIRLRIKNNDNEYMDLLADFTEFEEDNNPRYNNPDSHYHKVGSFISKYYDEIAGNSSLSNYYNEIIRPLQNYLIENQLYKNHPIGKLIIKKGKNLSVDYNELKTFIKQVKYQYELFTKEFSEMNYKLKN